MKTAIHYTCVKTPPKAGQIYGLQVAILDWLIAYMRHARQEKLTFLVGSEAAMREVQEVAEAASIDPKRLVMLDARFGQNLVGIDYVFHPDPDPHDLLWQRNAFADANFSFCGLAHAVAGRDGGEVLEKYCLGPSRPSDAIICPSQAIRDVIARFWDHYADYLKQQFGVSYTCPVRLPVIPLGVDTARIKARVSPEKRAEQRQKLGLTDDAIAVLWVGRLSHAIKAHPLPMFRAVEDAAKRTGKKLHLIMQGYFIPDQAAQEFAALAGAVCHQAKVSFIANNDPRFPDGLWAGADIFLSLIDNMQESFGLTPIEAAAARLPRVISDWDGYRDHVRDGVDGFLIPTLQPPKGTGDDLASLLVAGRESYGGYLAKTAQCVAVDADAAAQALARLCDDPALRQRIADEAEKTLPRYDWATLVPAYEDAWEACAARRAPFERLSLIHPQTPDPFVMYEGFASHCLGPDDRFKLALQTEEVNALLRHFMNTLAMDMMVPAPKLPAILSALGRDNPPTIGQMLQVIPAADHPRLYRTLAWFLKMGIVTRL